MYLVVPCSVFNYLVVGLNVPCSSLWCFQRLPVTSPHGNFATVTSPQKLRHMVTLPHFEKVRGDVEIVGKCFEVWDEEGEMWEEL